MIDMGVNQRPLGFADSFFDSMKLLGEVETRSLFTKHLDHTAKMTLGALEPFDDVWMGVVNLIMCHPRNLSSG